MRIKISLSVIAALSLIVGAIWLNLETEEPPDLSAIETSQQMASVLRKEEVLVQWVYEHSNRISKAACKEIVVAALETKRPLLLLALMEVESNFIPTAISNKGAMGLTQVMPAHWEKELITAGVIKEKRDLFDVRSSITAGDFILDINLKKSKGDVSKALEMYLGGQDGAYLKKILANLANLYVLTGTK